MRVSVHLSVPSVDAGKSPPIPYVYVNSSGWVKSCRPVQVVLACSLEMYAFPFDKHNCSLSFRSWLHSGEGLRPPQARPPDGGVSLTASLCVHSDGGGPGSVEERRGRGPR